MEVRTLGLHIEMGSSTKILRYGPNNATSQKHIHLNKCVNNISLNRHVNNILIESNFPITNV